eukprot:5056968-Prymnesium_polylepis.2
MQPFDETNKPAPLAWHVGHRRSSGERLESAKRHCSTLPIGPKQGLNYAAGRGRGAWEAWRLDSRPVRQLVSAGVRREHKVKIGMQLALATSPPPTAPLAACSQLTVARHGPTGDVTTA